MKYCLFIAIFLIFSGCKKVDFDIQNLNDNKISIFGHAGMGWGQGYPLNTFESIQKCLNYNVAGTEIEIQMTKDSVLVAFHDEELDETTNGSGSIYNKTWSEIKDLTISNSPFPQYQIISLDDLFRNLNDISSHTFIFDCKNFNPDQSSDYINNYTNAILKIIDKYNLSDNAILELKKVTLIESFQSKRPDLQIFVYGSFNTVYPIAINYNLLGITDSALEIESHHVALAHENGIMVAVFNTFTRASNIEAINNNVDFIQTDRVEYLVNLLD